MDGNRVHVSIYAGLSGSDLQQLVAHEGSHVIEAQAFLLSGRDERVNPILLTSESAAFMTGAGVKPYTNPWTMCGDAPCRVTFGPDFEKVGTYLRSHPAYGPYLANKVY